MPVKNPKEATRVETRAIKEAELHFVNDGYVVEDVQRKPGHNGYDFLIKKNGIEKKIEVKGASSWGIPDPYVTEFDQNKKLVADMLCIVLFIGDEMPKICLIPRDAIPQELVSRRVGYRISGKFKKQSVLKEFVVPIRS